ncbi:MAG: hypothetical protein MJ238_06095 [Bacilli bacterium]|nr:hypothetical protein [Bacilli bacterium]
MILLFVKKRYITAIFSLLMGILYVIVDFGGFYLLSHTREIYFIVDGAKVLQGPLNTFLVLFWMSMSYGITNGAFIWLALNKDKYTVHFALSIFIWWICCPMLAKAMPDSLTIITTRTTNAYHWIMAVFLVVGYGFIIVKDILFSKDMKNCVKTLLYLNLIGFLVQFGWEFALFVSGIRPANEMSLQTMIVNSLVETNMGMPYFYYIHKFIMGRKNEDLSAVSHVSE